ncbi:hypothetical protein HDU81_001923 [Chytriomyces hyalinus]|nr:hypothetical protein HDU81_001923 [Chytriomyces hyalinus]
MLRTPPLTASRPETNALFPLIYYAIIPIYLWSLILNGTLLTAIFRVPSKLLVTRMHKIIALLLSVLFCFGLFIVSMHLGALFYGSQAYWQVVACGTCCFVIMTLHFNLLLAFERYNFLLFDKATYDSNRSYVGWVMLSCVLFVVGNMAVFITSPTQDLMSPSLPLQNSIWVALNPGCGIVTLMIVSYLYTCTFLHTSSTLRRDTKDSDISRRNERHVLWNCLLMSSTLYIAYLPATILWTVAKAVPLDDATWFWARVVADIFVSLDSIVTPLLICYFRADIRSVLYASFRRKQNLASDKSLAQVEEEEDDGFETVSSISY